MRKFNWDNQVAYYLDQGFTPQEANDKAEEDYCEWENEMAQEGKDKARGLE